MSRPVKPGCPSTTLRKMIEGKNKRRALPEMAALVELALARWNWQKTPGKLARKIGTSQKMICLMRMGLIPTVSHRSGQPKLDVFIRLGAVADLGLTEVLEIWKRCCVPRQYEPWRAVTCRWRSPRKRTFAGQDVPEQYRAAANHFLGEMIDGDGPSWNWRNFEREMEKQCERVGMTAVEAGCVPSPEGMRLGAYWAGGKTPEVVEECANLVRGEKPRRR